MQYNHGIGNAVTIKNNFSDDFYLKKRDLIVPIRDKYSVPTTVEIEMGIQHATLTYAVINKYNIQSYTYFIPGYRISTPIIMANILQDHKI